MAKKFLTHINLSGNQLLNAAHQPSAFAPNAMAAGQIYYNTAENALYYSTGTGTGSWQQLAAGTTSVASINNFTGAITINGTTGNISVTNNNGTLTFDIGSNVVTLSDIQTLTNKTLTDATLGNNLDANSNKIINLGAPSANTDAATKKYVDDTVANTTLNIQGTTEQIAVSDTSGSSTISLTSTVRIDSQIKIGTDTNAPVISLDAISGENYFGGNGINGYLEVRDQNNNTSFNVNSYGRITTFDGNGNQALRIQGSEISSRNGNSISIYASSSESTNLDLYASHNTSLGAGNNLNIYANDNNQGGVVSVSGSEIQLNSPTKVSNNSFYVNNEQQPIFQVDPIAGETTIKGTLRFLDQNAVMEATENVTNTTDFLIAADYSIRLNSTNGGISLEPSSWAYINDDAIVTEGATQTLTNKTIADNLHFQNTGGLSQIGANGNDLNIVSNIGNVNITSNNNNIVLNADGYTYLNSAAQGNEVVAAGWYQTLTNKTISDSSLGNDLNANQSKIVNLADPTQPQDAANKRYVDAAVAGLTWKDAVNLLLDVNVPLSGNLPLNDGSIDGHPVGWDGSTAWGQGYRILLTGQTTSSENGIYVLTIDTVNTTYSLDRAADSDTNDELKGAAVFVEEGTVYGKTSWIQSNHYIVNFANQSWTQFSGAGTYTVGNGLALNGTEFSFSPTSTGGLNSNGSIKIATGQPLTTDADGLKVSLGEGLSLVNGQIAIQDGYTTRKVTTSLTRLNSVNGDGLQWVVEHNLNSYDVISRVYQTSTGPDQYSDIEVDINRNSVNEITINVAQAVDNSFTMGLTIVG